MSQTKWILVCLTLLPVIGTVGTDGPVSENAAGSRRFVQNPPISVVNSRAVGLFRSARYREAAEAFRRSYEASVREGEYKCAAWYLNGEGAAFLLSFSYHDAMQAFLGARRLAERLGDDETDGVISLNLVALYLQLGDLSAAAVEADRAAKKVEKVPNSAYLGEALGQAAKLKARQGDLEGALPMFEAAARVADSQGDIALKSLVLNQLGFEYLDKGRLNEADRAMTEAFRLRLLGRDRDIGQSYRALGLLRIAQGDLRSAEVLLELALAAGQHRPGRVPGWADYHARGQLRVAQGRLGEAVDDFRHALALARLWRLEVLPSDSARLSAGVGLAQLYSSFIRAAGELSFETGRRSLAREAFDAAEESRAAGLRAVGGSDTNWRKRLSPEYGQTLTELRTARVALLEGQSQAGRDRVRRLGKELAEMEARAGSLPEAAHSDSAEGPARLFTAVSPILGREEALLSFHLDEPHSYVWTITRGGFSFERLAPAPRLRELIGKFSGAVRRNAADASPLGERLYGELFPRAGGLAKLKRRWLLSVGDALLDVPFASLVVGHCADRPLFLIERHFVTVLPGARPLVVARRLSQTAGELVQGQFLGVGDAIYNTADRRGHSGGGRAALLELPRLAASDAEIRACARAWRPDVAPALLEGAAATRLGLAAALERDPAVIHLATHVIRSAEEPPRQLIQLSLLAGGEPDYLGAEDIAAWHLRKPAIVVLSGCASGRPEMPPPVYSLFAVPSAAAHPPEQELLGLARAWLAAGAGAVVVSRWPTPDDTGELFLSFYNHLRANADDGAAAALAHAQIDMLESKTWRSAPGHWAAYFLVGKG